MIERRNRQRKFAAVTIGQQQHGQAPGPGRPDDLEASDRRSGGALSRLIIAAREFGNQNPVATRTAVQLMCRTARERSRRRRQRQLKAGSRRLQDAGDEVILAKPEPRERSGYGHGLGGGWIAHEISLQRSGSASSWITTCRPISAAPRRTVPAGLS